VLYSLPVGNEIGDEGAKAIGKAIEKNETMEELDLGCMTSSFPLFFFLFHFYVFSMSFFSPVLFLRCVIFSSCS